MKNLIIAFWRQILLISVIALCLLWASACTPVKKLTAINTKLESTTETNVIRKTDVSESGSLTDKTTKTTDVKAEKTIDQIEAESNDLETRITTYDTSKPVDVATGKPPVQQETITTNKKTRDKKYSEIGQNLSKTAEKKDIEADFKREFQQRIDSLLKENKRLIDKTKQQEVPVSNWWKWLLAGAAIPVVVGFAWRFKWYGVFLPKK